MRKIVFLNCLAACALLAAACGGDDTSDGSSGSGGSGGSNPAGQSGGGTGGGGTTDIPEDPINGECPQIIQPLMGANAPRGKCCHRASNKQRVAKQTGAMRTLEYRMNHFLVSNHQKTIGALPDLTINRFNNEEQSILFRITVPWADGKMAKGMGTFQVGAGRYNCGEGTYSFYSAKAAPVRTTLKDPQRWEAAVVPVVVNPDAANVADQIKPVWADNMRSRVPAFTPYLKTAADASGAKLLDWESSSQSFTFENSPKLDESLDCMGERDESQWVKGGQVRVYVRVDSNNQDPIMALGGITLSQFQAFGAGVAADKDKPAFDPTQGGRCMPGAADCKWVKLPESLCPIDPADQTKWGCHVGWAENPDMFKTNCTQEAPSGTLDPDKGATSEGQCCDPLGKSTTLPACNSWVNILDFVAAAAEITDNTVDEVQQNCMK